MMVEFGMIKYLDHRDKDCTVPNTWPYNTYIKTDLSFKIIIFSSSVAIL